jgi:hypothetical protein
MKNEGGRRKEEGGEQESRRAGEQESRRRGKERGGVDGKRGEFGGRVNGEECTY